MSLGNTIYRLPLYPESLFLLSFWFSISFIQVTTLN